MDKSEGDGGRGSGPKRAWYKQISPLAYLAAIAILLFLAFGPNITLNTSHYIQFMLVLIAIMGFIIFEGMK